MTPADALWCLLVFNGGAQHGCTVARMERRSVVNAPRTFRTAYLCGAQECGSMAALLRACERIAPAGEWVPVLVQGVLL